MYCIIGRQISAVGLMEKYTGHYYLKEKISSCEFLRHKFSQNLFQNFPPLYPICQALQMTTFSSLSSNGQTKYTKIPFSNLWALSHVSRPPYANYIYKPRHILKHIPFLKKMRQPELPARPTKIKPKLLTKHLTLTTIQKINQKLNPTN